MRRLILGTLVSALAVVLMPGLAAGGGSWFGPIESNIQAGDTITLVGFSGFGPRHDPAIGPNDPFYAYLEVDASKRTTGFPNVHDGMIPLGRITVDETGECCWQNYRLHVTFEVPADLADGYYDMVHCNDPCTTNFGELVGGGFYVGPPPEGWAGSAEASLNNPLVRELVEQKQLALTGPTAVDLAWVGVVLVIVGVAATRTAYLATSRRRPQT